MDDTEYNDNSHEQPEYNTYGENTPREERESAILQLINTDRRYKDLWNQLTGVVPDAKGNLRQGSNALCGGIFAEKVITMFYSIVNDTNFMTRKSDTEVRYMLYYSLKTLIENAWDDETVNETEIGHLINVVENNIELFMGYVEGGHGAKVATAILSGQNLDFAKAQKEATLSDYFTRK